METKVEKIYGEARQKRRAKRHKNRTLMRMLTTLIRGLLAGIVISLGSVAYLSISSKYLGAALFSVGLIVAFSYGLSLFTAKVGYFTVDSAVERLELLPMLIGNFGGAFLTGFGLSFTRFSSKLGSRAWAVFEENMNDRMFSVLILSFICGILIFFAADSFKNADNNIQKYLTVIAVSMIFILCGFEHSITNIFYLSISNTWSLKTALYILVMLVGNALGGALIPISHKAIELLRKN